MAGWSCASRTGTAYSGWAPTTARPDGSSSTAPGMSTKSSEPIQSESWRARRANSAGNWSGARTRPVTARRPCSGEDRAMQIDKLTIEILEDSTIKTTSDEVSAANHDNAEQWLTFKKLEWFVRLNTSASRLNQARLCLNGNLLATRRSSEKVAGEKKGFLGRPKGRAEMG